MQNKYRTRNNYRHLSYKQPPSPLFQRGDTGGICAYLPIKFRRRALTLLLLIVMGCGKGSSVSIVIGDPEEIGPTDPPYLPAVAFPSGLRLDLVTDAVITNTYPAPEGNPFGTTRARHYERVLYFIDLSSAPLSERVSENFRLSEYVNPVVQRGGQRAYIDAQVAEHLQQIRSGLGRALIVNSGFRDPEHNRDVGGATFSRHIYGDGVDADVDQTRSDANTRAQEIFNEARDVGVDFVLPLTETSVMVNGQSRVSWVHIDDRGF
jgi:hypothetical protein